MQDGITAVATTIEARGKIKICHMWDLGIKARVPLPKKRQNYSSHIAQFVVFFSDDSKKETSEAEVYVRTYMNCCGSDYNRTVRP